MAGCPPIITQGVIVGEADGVERLDEAGDVLSSCNGTRRFPECDSSGFVIEDGNEL